MVDICSCPLALRLRSTFPSLGSHGSLSQAMATVVLSPFPLYCCSSPAEQDRMLNCEGTTICWISFLNWLSVMCHRWAGGRAAAPVGQAQALG